MADPAGTTVSTPLSAEHMIESLASRVRELALHVASLEGELAAAHTRVAVYERFESHLQESLAAALHAAQEIRERALVTARALTAEAQAQQPTETTHVEALRIEGAALRGAVDRARTAAPRAVAAAPAISDATASVSPGQTMEALRGVFTELVDEIRREAAPAPITVRPPVAVRPPAPTPPPPAPPPPPATVAPPAAVAQASVIAPPPPPPATTPGPAATPGATIADALTELQLILSPVQSFPRLVEIERQIQSLAPVRTLYVRDFRNGTATLAVGLSAAMTSQQFVHALSTLEHPRLRVLSTTRDVLELRVDTVGVA